MAQVSVNVSEVRRVLKSPEMRAFLSTECDAAAARCNSLAQFHSPMYADAYGSYTSEGKYTAIGHVATRRIGRNGTAAIYENAAHNTLLKGCGW